MGLLSQLLRPFKKTEKPVTPLWITYETQLCLEARGAEAALEGKCREDCPYDPITQPIPWNHWVYGNENEWGGGLPIIRVLPE